jgi:hypothetical protein
VLYDNIIIINKIEGDTYVSDRSFHGARDAFLCVARLSYGKD